MESPKQNLTNKRQYPKKGFPLLVFSCALAVILAVTGLILFFVKPAAADDDLKPLHEITVSNVAELEDAWNDAVTNQETNTKITLTGNIIGILQKDGYRFGTGAGFTTAGGLLVPEKFRLALDLNGYRLDKGGIVQENGSAILNNGNLTIVDSNTANLTHSFEIQGKTYSVTGGAIIGGSTLTDGGGIYNNGTLNFNGGIIANCNAEYRGGGIVTTPEAVTNINGGKLCYNYSNTTTDGVYGGGAVAVLSRAVLNVNGGVFEHNQAATYGGAILATAGATINSENLQLRNNSANYGGGLATAGTATIQTATVQNNNAILSGGGMYVIDGTLDVHAGSFTGNTAQQNTANAEGDGGGAIAVKDGTLRLHGTRSGTNSNLTFTGNAACFGGALANAGGTIEATGLVITGNSVDHNSVFVYGGGVVSHDGVSNYRDCYFTANNSQEFGKIKTWGSGRSLAADGGELNIIGGLIEKHGDNNGNAVAYSRDNSEKRGVINFMGDVVLQYNTWLYDGNGGIVNFDGATVQYCGYASPEQYANNSGSPSRSSFVIGSTDHWFFMNYYKINAHHNRATWGFARTSTETTQVGRPDGTNEDVIFRDNQCGIFTSNWNTFGGDIWHGTFENNVGSSTEPWGAGVISLYSYSQGTVNIYDGIFRGNSGNRAGVISVFKSNTDSSYSPSVHIYGGTFANNTGKIAGAIYSSDPLAIAGGTFTGNTGDQGTVVCSFIDRGYDYERSLTISGGTFTNNTNNGPVVHVQDARIKTTITGGTFTNNHANNATVAGINSAAEINFGGSPIIKNNTVGSSKTIANLYSPKPLNIVSKLTGQAGDIGVSLKGQFTRNYSIYNGALTTPPRNYFISDYGNYKIERVDGEAVASPQSSSQSYALVPTALNAPNYTGSAQPIMAGYVSEKMEVVSIRHTWFNESEQATLSSNTETLTNLPIYLDARTGEIIVTAPGAYAVTFRIKAGNVWLKADGSTATGDVTVTAQMNKMLYLIGASGYRSSNYTGEEIESLSKYQPAIPEQYQKYLSGWSTSNKRVTVAGDRVWCKDATSLADTAYAWWYGIDFKPIYHSGMGKYFYTNDVNQLYSIRGVNINHYLGDTFTVEVNEADYTGSAVKPRFDVYFRGQSLGYFNGNTWVENTARPFGPFKIKDVVYSNNINPSAAGTVRFAVDTDYHPNGTTVGNFYGITTVNFTINGRSINEEASVEIVGEPLVTTEKIYDGTRLATVDWRGRVTMTGGNGRLVLSNIVATYDNVNVGENKSITVRYVFSGPDAWLYSYKYTIDGGVITPQVIDSITGLTANKVYDGTVSATLDASHAEFSGKLDGDALSVTFADATDALTYYSAGVGTNKEMVYHQANLVLTGAHAGNYVLADDFTVEIVGTITPARLSATATAYSGVYDRQAHAAITSQAVTFAAGASDADRASVQWEYSFDQVVWENEIPLITKAMNVQIYYRVSADNHATYNGEVRFALAPLSLQNAAVNLGQTQIIYDGNEHNLNPQVTMNVKGENVILQQGDDYKLSYQNSYTAGEYDNGNGDTKNVGTVTITVSGSGSNYVGTANIHPQFVIKPQSIALPAADENSYYYNGNDQTYLITTNPAYSILGNVQREIGEHQVAVILTDKHNTVWANGNTDDLAYDFTIYGATVTVDWVVALAHYYVGKEYTGAEALAGTIGHANDGTEVTGVVEFITADGKLLVTDDGNAHNNPKNPNFDLAVKVRFIPTDTNFAPVVAEITLPAKYIVVTFNSNTGASSGVLQNTYAYGDAIIYLDKTTNETVLQRPYYTHIGWTVDTAQAPISLRGLTESETKALLAELGVVDLGGEVLADADVTYYAMWSYVDYVINFYKNNPQQYGTLSEDFPVNVDVAWADGVADAFVNNYNGTIVDTNAAYIYTFNYADWNTKQQNMLFSSITWNTVIGFEFDGWRDDTGTIQKSLGTLKNLDLYAQWRGLSYNVNYVNALDGKVIGVGKVTNGAVLTAEAVPNPVSAGFNFSGWYLTGTAAATDNNDGAQRIILHETKIWTTGDITLYAGWTRKKVVVEIVTAPGLDITVIAQDIDSEEEKVLYTGDFLAVGAAMKIKVVERSGYAFDGVSIAVAGEVANYTSAEFTYTVNDYDSDAARIPLVITGNYHAVIYHLTYSHALTEWDFVAGYVHPQNFTVDDTVTLPIAENVQRPGYTFVGWYTDSSLNGAVIKNTRGLAGDITLYPQWQAKQQNIVLYKGGQVYATILSTTDSNYVLTDLTKEAGFDDYTFLGWSEQADLGGIILPAGSNFTVKPSNNNLYAVWAFRTGNLTLNTDKVGDWYNFGETVITMTPHYDYFYHNIRNGIKTTYRFFKVDNAEEIVTENDTLSISQVADTGSYYCTITITDNGYARPITLESAAVAVEVWHRNLENAVFATLPNMVYTGEALNPELPNISLDGHTLLPDVDFTYEYTNNLNAKMWAHLIITGKGSFVGSVDKAAFYIEPATMTANVTAYTGVYDGIPHAAIVTQDASVTNVTWLYAEHSEGPYSAAVPVYQNAGNYPVYYRVTYPNYVNVEGVIGAIIIPKTLDVVWGEVDFVYNAHIQEPTATVTTGIDGEVVTLTVTSPQTKNVGEYTATAITADTNYTLNNAVTAFTIAPKTITATITPNGGQRQEETIIYATAVLHGVLAGDEPTIKYTYSNYETGETVQGLPTLAGNYLVTITVEDNNYRLNGLHTAPFLIRAADETITNYITVQQDDWLYGDTPSELVFMALDGEDDAVITYYYLVDGRRVELSTDDVNDRLSVGTYYVHVFIPAIEVGYNESYGRTAAEAEHEFHVLPRPLAINWLQTTFEYDATRHVPQATITNLLDGDECEVTIDVAVADGIDAGTYTATITQPTNTNYTLPNVTTQDFVITARKITVTIADQTSVYGEEVAPLTAVVTSGHICDEDKTDGYVYTLTKEDGDTVGTYQINGNNLNANYAITFTNQDHTRNYAIYTITLKTAVVNWDFADDLTYTGATQVVAAYLTSVNTDKLYLSVQISQNNQEAIFRDVGTYDLTAVDESGNYSLINAEQTVTIVPATLYIRADDVAVRYGEEITLTATITGFVGDEDERVLTPGHLTTTYAVNDNIQGDGNYPITVSGYTNSNYQIEYTNGILHVEGIKLKVAIKNQTSVYGDNILDPEYYFIGESILNPSAVFTVTKDDGAAAGTYAIRGAILNHNYAIEFVNEQGENSTGIYVITPRQITVRIFDRSSVYGEVMTPLVADVADNAIIGADNVDGSVYTLVKENGNNVGKYQINGVSTNANYAVTFVSAIDEQREYAYYTIEKADFNLKIDYELYQGVYDGKEHDVLTIKSPMPNGDFIWQFSIAGDEYTTDLPQCRLPGQYQFNFKIVSTNYKDYTVENLCTNIERATLKIIIGHNTVEKGKPAKLDAFEIIGIAESDNPSEVVTLLYLDQIYETNNAEIGDQFDLTAILNEAYQDRYIIETIEYNVLTVIEPQVNAGLIIGLIAAGVAVAAICGGAAAAVIAIKKRKRKLSQK